MAVDPGDGNGRHLAVIVVSHAQGHTFGAHLSRAGVGWWASGGHRGELIHDKTMNDHGPSVGPGRGGLK